MFERPVYPLLIAGDFSVKSGKIAAPEKLNFGDLAAHGLPFYCGRIAAETKVKLPKSKKIKLKVKLQNISVECFVDGVSIGFQIDREGGFDLSRFAGKAVKISLVGANLPHNLWESGKGKMPFGFAGIPQLYIME